MTGRIWWIIAVGVLVLYPIGSIRGQTPDISEAVGQLACEGTLGKLVQEATSWPLSGLTVLSPSPRY